MRVLNGFLGLKNAPRACVATIGNFDGVHLGHQRILEKVRERARALRIDALAVAFDPHPLKILRPDKAPRTILTRQQKVEILAAQGMDLLLFIPFSHETAQVEAERFVEEFLIGTLGVRELYVGVDFRFGKDRKGDLALLRQAASERRFVVESLETVSRGGERVSASRIRAALERGDVREARAMMGRPYEAIGEVVRGAGRGRAQGAPTANLAVANEVIPASGVYLTETRLEERLFPSLTNIGTRPTFENAGFAVETWLPDFTGDLYGHRLRVLFHERIRDEIKFASPEALRQQIDRDLQSMRDYFARSPGNP